MTIYFLSWTWTERESILNGPFSGPLPNLYICIMMYCIALLFSWIVAIVSTTGSIARNSTFIAHSFPGFLYSSCTFMKQWMNGWMNEMYYWLFFCWVLNIFLLLIFWVLIVITLKCVLLRKTTGNDAAGNFLINVYFITSPMCFFSLVMNQLCLVVMKARVLLVCLFCTTSSWKQIQNITLKTCKPQYSFCLSTIFWNSDSKQTHLQEPIDVRFQLS